jgi:hypothetical protein
MGLDFYEKKTNILTELKTYIELSEVGHDGQSLDIEDIDIANLEDLKHLLQEKNSLVTIYTRNRKTIEHFCEYNDCTAPKIFDI